MKWNKSNLSDLNSIFVIAEIGVNHEGDFNSAKKLIDAAAEGGADAVKFQTYKAETLAVKNSPAYWDLKQEATENQYDLFRKYDNFNLEEYAKLKLYCDQSGIEFCSTPFDLAAVEMLDPLVSFFKIASSDITNFPLIRAIAKKKKPILLSTGASTIDEIRNAILEIERHGVNEIGILHCILNYPTENINANLNMLKDLINKFPDYVIGYSDHTVPDKNLTVLSTAILCGAKIIEKHFTLDKELPGNDHYHSMDKNDLKNLRFKLSQLQSILGQSEKTYIKSELKSRLNARRSLYYLKNMKMGEAISEMDLIALRPAIGVSPNQIDFFINKKLIRNVEALEPALFEDVQ